MADKKRFEVFAQFLIDRFADAERIFDVAGGMGRLNAELTRRGRRTTTFDQRHKHLDVPYAQRRFTLDEPCEADLVVGLHADGATRLIIDYAARHQIPFAVVPCCSDNGMPYHPWLRHLRAHAASLQFRTGQHDLPLAGRARVLFGEP